MTCNTGTQKRIRNGFCFPTLKHFFMSNSVEGIASDRTLQHQLESECEEWRGGEWKSAPQNKQLSLLFGVKIVLLLGLLGMDWYCFRTDSSKPRRRRPVFLQRFASSGPSPQPISLHFLSFPVLCFDFLSFFFSRLLVPQLVFSPRQVSPSPASSRRLKGNGTPSQR